MLTIAFLFKSQNIIKDVFADGTLMEINAKSRIKKQEIMKIMYITLTVTIPGHAHMLTLAFF